VSTPPMEGPGGPGGMPDVLSGAPSITSDEGGGPLDHGLDASGFHPNPRGVAVPGPRRRLGVMAPASRRPESAAGVVLLRLEAHDRGSLLAVEEREVARHRPARLLGQLDEALNIGDVVGVTVEDDEGDGERRHHGDPEKQSRQPESEPERRLCGEKCHFMHQPPCHIDRV
jgi:hypothetical protein